MDISPVSHIVVFIVAWWLILFTLLPVGVKTHEESGEDQPEGTADSAPVKPGIKWKMLTATAGAAVVWGMFYFVAANHLVSLY